MSWLKWGMFCLISPNYGLITWLKQGLPQAQKTALLRTWSRTAVALTATAIVGLLVIERLSTINCWIIMGLGVVAFWRANEIVLAFFTDALSRLGGEPQTTTFTAPERLKFVVTSYLELIACYGLVYLGLQTLLLSLFGQSVKAFKSALPSVADAIYLSSTVVTTLGYGDSDPATWSSKILTICEVFSGFILFAVALAVYLGSEKTVPSAGTVGPASTPPQGAPMPTLSGHGKP